MNTETIKTIKELLQKSNGKLIPYGANEYSFEHRQSVSEAEITQFEERYKVKIPLEYRTFLLEVGACSLFVTDYGLGVDFLPPDEMYDWSRQVFDGTGEDLFPEVLLIGSAHGHPMGFFTAKQDANFGVFYAEIPPEYWEEDTDLMSLNQWIEQLLDERLK